MNTLVVCGCNFPNCPRTTIYEASERGYRVVAVADAISGIYARGMLELEGIGVEPIRAEDCLCRLGTEVTKQRELLAGIPSAPPATAEDEEEMTYLIGNARDDAPQPSVLVYLYTPYLMARSRSKVR